MKDTRGYGLGRWNDVERGGASLRMLGALFATSLVAALVAGSLTSVGSSKTAAPRAAGPLSWLTSELGPQTETAPLRRHPARGVQVVFQPQGFSFATAGARVEVSTDATGRRQTFRNGVSRATGFGGETITVTPAQTELYDTVTARQGRRTWRWRLDSTTAPALRADGSVVFAGAHPITVAPVKIYGPGRLDVTPKGSRWSLERAGATWNLTLRLDDATLPLPYVIDPAFSASAKPNPLLHTFFADGATGVWALDETSGATAADAVTAGNGGDGTYNGTIGYAQSRLVNDGGKSISLNGAAANNVSIPSVTTPKTVELWVQVNPGDGGYTALFSNRASVASGLSQANTIDIGLDTGRVFSYSLPSGTYEPVSATRIDDGARHQIVWANDGTTGCIYIDGVSAHCQAQAISSPPTYTAFIGHDDADGAGFNGKIDDVAIYDTTLTANQVAAHYNQASRFGLTVNAGTNTFPAALPAAGQVTAANGPIPTTGTKLFYKPNASATFTVTANTGDATTTSVAPTGAVANLSQPSFTGPGATWTSGTYTAQAGLATEVTPTVRITNANGSADGTFTLTPDATAPTGGALTVNGTVATSGGSTSTTTSTSFAIDTRTNFAEAASSSESGLASTNLVRQSYPFVNNACGGTEDAVAVTVSGTTNSGVSAGHCYVYTLTGIDNVGNSALLTTTVRVLGAPHHLVVTAPATATAGTAFSITVTAKDVYENTTPGYTGTVGFTSTDTAATLPSNYTFVSGDNGAHTFTNGVNMHTAGSKTITATDTVTSSINGFATVNVSAASSNHIVFLQQPTTTGAGASITPPVTVQFRDTFDNPTSSTANVTLAIKAGTGDSSATLSGTLTRAAVAGTATFNDLSINKVATGYVLTATTSASGTADSTAFNITPGAATHLTITSSTANLAMSASRTITAVVKDANENTVTGDNSTSVTFAKQSGAGNVTGLGSATAVNGVASKSVTASGAGQITIGASAAGLTGATTTFTIDAAPSSPPPTTSTPPPAPVFKGASPEDGATVTAAKTITLNANVNVYWTQLKLRFAPADGGPATTTDLVDQGGSSATFFIGATNQGLYTLNGFMIGVEGGGKVAFSTHFTVFTPAPTPGGGSPPTATAVSSSGGGTLVTAAGTERVTWTPGSFPSNAAELRVAPQSTGATPVADGLTLETRTLSVGLFTSSGTAIHELTGPIEIVLDGAAENHVPALSENGTTWRALTLLPANALPAEQADGYWREQLTATTYRIHIWTRHLTMFGLLKDTKAPSAPTGLAGTAGADSVTLKWDPSTDNSGNVVSYVIALNGGAIKTVPASVTTATVNVFPSNDARVYQVYAVDAAGNISSLSAGIAQVPSLIGLSLSGATALLTQQGFTVGRVVQDAPGDAASATVTAQSPLPPALAPLGAPVDVNVSVATGHAQLVVLTYEATSLLLKGTRYVQVRVKVTVPVGLTAFLAGPQGKRFAHWKRHLDAGVHTPRLAIPAKVTLVKGRRYHLEMYFSGGGQTSGLRRTIIR